MSARRIYLDYAATTPLAPEARSAMEPFLGPSFGNPSSLHEDGRKAKDAIDAAREVLSDALGSLFAEVLFTSSGTEAANMAILGAALQHHGGSRKRVLMGAAEHHCVLHLREVLAILGFVTELVPVDRHGLLDISQLRSLMGDDVLLVSVMHANNELGTLQPVKEVAECCQRCGALFHCDAVQTFLSLRWTVGDLGADMVSLSSHKVYGPKGVGALYVRAGVKLKPLMYGGGQEREMRAGTENVAGIAGFAGAVRALLEDPAREARKAAARNAFRGALDSRFVRTVPEVEAVLAGHAHVRCPGIAAESMLILLDRMGVSASSGAACSSGSLEPSHVLLACGFAPTQASEGLRFTFGKDTPEEDALEAAARVNSAALQILGSRA